MFSIHRYLGSHTQAVVSLKYSRSGEYLASACADKSVRIVSSNGTEKVLRGHEAGVNDIVWLDDSGRYLASASDDCTIRIWDVEKESSINVLKGHDDFVFCLDQHPQHNILISGSYDEQVKVWDSRSFNYCIHSIPAHASPVTSVSFDSTGLEFFSAGTDGQIRVWNTRDGYCRRTFGLTTGLATVPPVSSMYCSPNGKYLMVSTLDDTHRLWALDGVVAPSTNTTTRSSQCSHRVPGAVLQPVTQEPTVVRQLTGHVNRSMSMSSQLVCIDSTQCLISGSEDNKVYIWNLSSGELIQTLEGHQGPVLSVAYDPVRQVLASCSSAKDPSIFEWTHSRRDID